MPFLAYSFNEQLFRASPERGILIDHRVNDTAEAPNINPIIIFLKLQHLWGLIKQRANIFYNHRPILVLCCNSKVTNFNKALFRCKYILGFKISMKNFSVMDMFHCKSHLYKPIQNLIFSVTHLPYLILVCNFSV